MIVNSPKTTLQPLLGLFGFKMEKYTSLRTIADDIQMYPYSYLLCRQLLKEEYIEGEAVIGIYKKELVQTPETELAYTNSILQYSWIETKAHTIIDPLIDFRAGNQAVNLNERSKTANYHAGVNPLKITKELLPKHRCSDEVFTLMRGAESEAMRRILGLEQNPNGITMTEAAYIANYHTCNYLGYDRIILNFFIKHKLTSILINE
uniref:Uncharacterized protein n=4 Tax=Morganellaceae TaxID=1903414 RepID=A0A7L4ZCY8_PROMI|nr:hypothetical protein [Proteus mirabilis]QHE90029.1 hypothetical protein [Proteus mirabilis]WBR55673.1 hypothetical protein [Proteus mirabilis]